MTREQIQSQTDEALHAIVASTNPAGKFAEQVGWAKQEIGQRSMRGALEWIVSARPGWRAAAERAAEALHVAKAAHQ